LFKNSCTVFSPHYSKIPALEANNAKTKTQLIVQKQSSIKQIRKQSRVSIPFNTREKILKILRRSSQTDGVPCVMITPGSPV
jgi:hypothetical protein